MAYPDLILADSPRLYWRFNETTGSVLNDSSPWNMDGEVDAVKDEPGGIIGDPDPSMYFGFNRDADLPTSQPWMTPDSTGYFTLECLFRWNGAPPSSQNRPIYNFIGGLNWSWSLAVETDGVLRIGPRKGRDDSAVSSGYNICDNNWHHIGIELTRLPGNHRRDIYVDGVLRGTSTDEYDSASGGRLAIGRIGTNFPYTQAWIDELAVYDHLIGADAMAARWWEARQGQITAQTAKATMEPGTWHLSIGKHVPAEALNLGVKVGTHALSEPLRPGPIDDPSTVAGPLASYKPGALYVGSIGELTDEVIGPITPATPAEAQILYPMSVASLSAIPGPWIPRPVVPSDPAPIRPIPVPVPVSPTYPDGVMYIEGAMTVGGATNVTAANCRPTLNGVGSGSFTRKGSVSNIGATVQFKVAGRTTMTGVVTETRDAQVDSGEEASQLQTMTVAATAHELAKVLVLPDFGAMDLTRIGPPTQDVRVFDWTANGIGDWSGDGNLYTPGVTPPPQTVAVGVDALHADQVPLTGPWNITFPLPDVWPDNSSQWIWWISPRIPAGKGWALFRVPTPKPPQGPVQFWLCAYDYAELWVDGVKAVVCDTPGKAMHIQIEDLRSDYHLLAIRAYTRGGRAGVMCSMLPVQSNGLYGKPTMNSRSGWVAIPYQDAFIYTPGAVLRRLFYEAKQRGDFPSNDWKLNFTNQLDSNGVPWPIPEWPIEIDVGVSLLDVLNRLAGDMIDWSESPSGRELNAYIKGTGTGASHSLPWTQAVDLSSKGVAKMERA